VDGESHLRRKKVDCTDLADVLAGYSCSVYKTIVDPVFRPEMKGNSRL